jgi:hypothetical protein
MYSEMRVKYGAWCDFVTVYMEEAHPEEKKHFAGNIPINTHQNMQVKGIVSRGWGGLLMGSVDI